MAARAVAVMLSLQRARSYACTYCTLWTHPQFQGRYCVCQAGPVRCLRRRGRWVGDGHLQGRKPVRQPSRGRFSRFRERPHWQGPARHQATQAAHCQYASRLAPRPFPASPHTPPLQLVDPWLTRDDAAGGGGSATGGYVPVPTTAGAFIGARARSSRRASGLTRSSGWPQSDRESTLGTGSETTGTAIFDFKEIRAKTGITSRAIKPFLGIIDPDNTKTMPRSVRAASGLDVLWYGPSAFTVPAASPDRVRPRSRSLVPTCSAAPGGFFERGGGRGTQPRPRVVHGASVPPASSTASQSSATSGLPGCQPDQRHLVASG